MQKSNTDVVIPISLLSGGEGLNKNSEKVQQDQGDIGSRKAHKIEAKSQAITAMSLISTQVIPEIEPVNGQRKNEVSPLIVTSPILKPDQEERQIEKAVEEKDNEGNENEAKFEVVKDEPRPKSKVPRLNLVKFKKDLSQTYAANVHTEHEYRVTTDINKRTKKKKHIHAADLDRGRSHPWLATRGTEDKKTRHSHYTKQLPETRSSVYSERPEADGWFRQDPYRRYENEEDSGQRESDENERGFIMNRDSFEIEHQMSKMAMQTGTNPHKQADNSYWERTFHKFSHKLYKSLIRNQEHLMAASAEWEKINRLTVKMRKEIDSIDSEENSEDAYFDLMSENTELLKEIHKLRRDVKTLTHHHQE